MCSRLRQVGCPEEYRVTAVSGHASTWLRESSPFSRTGWLRSKVALHAPFTELRLAGAKATTQFLYPIGTAKHHESTAETDSGVGSAPEFRNGDP
jgi:hypothetical protein